MTDKIKAGDAENQLPLAGTENGQAVSQNVGQDPKEKPRRQRKAKAKATEGTTTSSTDKAQQSAYVLASGELQRRGHYQKEYPDFLVMDAAGAKELDDMLGEMKEGDVLIVERLGTLGSTGSKAADKLESLGKQGIIPYLAECCLLMTPEVAEPILDVVDLFLSVSASKAPNKATPELKEKVLQMGEDGATIPDIIAATGLSQKTISNIRKAAKDAELAGRVEEVKD